MSYTIDKTTEHQTVEQYLRGCGYSKSLIRSLKQKPDGITVCGRHTFTTRRLMAGEQLTITMTEEPLAGSPPSSPDLSVVYEDNDILVVDKAAGIAVHPSQGNHGNTLADQVAFYLGQKGEAGVYRVINRLDRDTTGLLILAKHALSACILAEQMRRHQIHRRYAAIVCGRIDRPGVIDAPIARVDGSTIERCVDDERGEAAVTYYRPVDYDALADCSLLAVTLGTGRTHQIRVHMKSIGHPIPGDFLYHPDYSRIGRQALHSCSLSFVHPLKKERLHFEAPLPNDMRFSGFKSIEGLWDNDS